MVSAITPNEMPISRSDLLAPGTVLGRHRIEGKLAEGAMATLYLAEHVQTRSVVAIKVLKWAYADSPEAIARFDREAIVMGRLSTATHVVHVIDVGRTPDGRRFLAMEFVRGTELASVIATARRKSESFAVDRACRIARDVAAGIRDAHAKAVVHRDIKPANIMLYREPDGREVAKIVDFGVSADLGATGPEADLTVTGSVIGTAEYMAPEQAAGLPADPVMDVFAIGVVLWELLTLELLPRARVLAGEQLDVRAVRREVPEAVAELLRECLTHEPSARPDAGAVAQRLTAALLAMSGSVESLRKWSDARPKEAVGAIDSAAAVAVAAADAGQVDAARKIAPIGPEDPTPRESEGDDGARPSPLVVEQTAEAGAGPVIVLVGIIALVAAVVVVSMGLQGRDDAAQQEPPPPASEAEMFVVPDPRAGDPEDDGMRRPLPSITDIDTDAPTPSTESDAVQPATAKPAGSKPVPTKAGEPGSSAASDPKSPNEGGAAAPEPKPAGKSSPASETPACVKARADAIAAAQDLGWKSVLAKTADRACWPSAIERLRLRVEALSELKKFDACVREGEASKDVKVAKIVGFCKKRLGQE